MTAEMQVIRTKSDKWSVENSDSVNDIATDTVTHATLALSGTR